MTHAEIEAFLAICRWKNITHAAEQLYISQTSLSTRLKTLEKELGGVLFYRKRGYRETVLTPLGEEFYDLAVQYEDIVNRMNGLCRSDPGKLRIGLASSVSIHLFSPFYRLFIERYPDIQLVLEEKVTTEADLSLNQGSIDLALTTDNRVSGSVVAIPVSSEPMVFVCSKDAPYSDVVDKESLNIKKEIHIVWSGLFESWYYATLAPKEGAKIQMAMTNQLRRFLEQEDCWAIVPAIVARGLTNEGKIRQCKLNCTIPRHSIYLLVPSGHEKKDVVRKTLECLWTVLEDMQDIGVERYNS